MEDAHRRRQRQRWRARAKAGNGVRAIQHLGTFELPGQPFNSLSEGKLDADDGMGLGVFDHNVGEVGGLVPVTPYISVTGG